MSIHGFVWVNKVAAVEELADALDVVGTEGVAENGPEILNALGGWLELRGIVEAGREGASVDVAPSVADLVGVGMVEDEAAILVLDG